MKLDPHPTFAKRPGPVVLCILDGVGLGAGGPDDAVARARTPVLDALRQEHPFRSLRAHGTAVGLPSDGDMGNSEVGHNAMGAGRVFDQGAKLVDQALRSGKAFQTELWRALVDTNTLHLIGLVSDGNVHSHVDHLHRLIEQAAADGVTRLRVHVLTDGRDVDQRSALTWVKPLEEKLAGLGDFKIAGGGGRMHLTMDRYEADWEMVARGWRTHVHGEGRAFDSASEAIQTLYDEHPDLDDQWLPAFVVCEGGEPVGRIEDGHGVLFFNFRGDRAIEISRAFEEDEFSAFDRGMRPNVTYAGMMQYDGDLQVPKRYLVAPPNIEHTVGEYLAKNGLRSFACSETHKYGHVTYFFNGNNSGTFDAALETFVEIKSDRGPLEERPWMKCAEITDRVVQAIASGRFDHVRLNLANGDMVGHTGVLESTITAVQAVDLQVGRLKKAVEEADGVLIVTADHGNADEMWMRKGGQISRTEAGVPKKRTSHTLSPVPAYLFDPRGELDFREDVPDAGLANLAATLIEALGLQAPADYEPSLLRSSGS